VIVNDVFLYLRKCDGGKEKLRCPLIEVFLRGELSSDLVSAAEHEAHIEGTGSDGNFPRNEVGGRRKASVV
jgi:hypothetical protein